jgi:hypothetical protein
MTRKELQSEVETLIGLKHLIESEEFQKHFAKPMKAERDKLRTAFFSDSLKESWRKGGKQEGIKLFMDLVAQIPIDLKNKKYELDNFEE